MYHPVNRLSLPPCQMFWQKANKNENGNSKAKRRYLTGDADTIRVRKSERS